MLTLGHFLAHPIIGALRSNLVPVSFITIHAYRSWMPDHPRGYVRRGEGVLPPDPEMNEFYEDQANFDEAVFTPARQQVLVEATREVCGNLKWRLHYVVCVRTHVHIVVSWQPFKDWRDVHDRMKRLLGLKLARHEKTVGRSWLSKGRDAVPVKNVGHFEHLMTKYLPDHHGATWHERMPGPRVCSGH